MKNMIKHWLKKATIGTVVLGLFMSTTLTSYARMLPAYDPAKVLAVDDVKVKIWDVELDQGVFDPHDNQDVEITFAINKAAEINLEILDEDNDKVVTLIDEKIYQEGEHTVEWDGEDKYGDIVDDGEYTYKLIAWANGDMDKETGEIYVKEGYESDDETEDPRLKRVFATKEEFDPGRKESTYIVFTTMAKADIRVSVYDSIGKEVEELYDKDDQKAGTYAVEWDGEEADGKEGTYTYKVQTDNSKDEDLATGEIVIKDDDKDDKKPNLYKDKTDETHFAPKDGNLEIYFKLDKNADITVEIRDDDNVVDTIIDGKELSEGPHTVAWDGKDKYGDYLGDGIYTYKVIAENLKGKDVEFGNFELMDTSVAGHPEGQCGVFYDVDEDNKYCDAIEWAYTGDIFKGYTDGTFKPNTPINRAEALKVIMTAMGVDPIEVGNVNFKDVYAYAWYVPYLKSALSLGIVKGYSDGTFKPEMLVSRAEALVMTLNTGKAKHQLIVPTNTAGIPYFDTPFAPDTAWFFSYAWMAKAYELTDNDYYFYPNSFMTRGEMADLLYRYFEAGLDS